ncbi:MAG: SGNH/GDSL hydrolase family protein [Candidatus Magasanikbacteria bacterium]
MKLRILIFVFFGLILLIGLYLNRSYARMYSTMSAKHLLPPSEQTHFTLGNEQAAITVTYIALGDSLTAGTGVDRAEDMYAYRIAERIAKKQTAKVEFVNLGVPGAVVKDLLDVQLTRAIEQKPTYITLLIGVNDVHARTPLLDFENQYEQIVKRLNQETNAKIAVISIPYVGAPSLFLPPYQYYFDNKTREYNRVIKNIANTYSLQYIDLYSAMEGSFKKDEGLYSEDLFHPGATGYYLWAEYIYANLNS